MATSVAPTKKSVKGGGVIGAIVPPKPKVDSYPLMSYVAKNCTFEDDEQGTICLETEEALKAANNRRFENLLSEAAFSAKEMAIGSVPSDDEDNRKRALQMIHSLELARNKEDTWKVSEPTDKKKPDYAGFLHPLKREETEEYFSGMKKVKQARERNRSRSRSDDVVFLDDGKLVSKATQAQLPIQLNLPLRPSSTRVPSVGLPFTPAPPPSNVNNAWMQRSGSELFSSSQSSTLTAYGVGCDEEEAMAMAIAESIRTAKEEQQRQINLRAIYNTPTTYTSAAQPAAQPTAQPVERPPSDPFGISWDADDELKKQPQVAPLVLKNRLSKLETQNDEKPEVEMSQNTNQRPPVGKASDFHFSRKLGGSEIAPNLPSNEQRSRYSADTRENISKSSSKNENDDGVEAYLNAVKETATYQHPNSALRRRSNYEYQAEEDNVEMNSFGNYHSKTDAASNRSRAWSPTPAFSSGKEGKVYTVPSIHSRVNYDDIQSKDNWRVKSSNYTGESEVQPKNDSEDSAAFSLKSNDVISGKIKSLDSGSNTKGNASHPSPAESSLNEHKSNDVGSGQIKSLDSELNTKGNASHPSPAESSLNEHSQRGCENQSLSGSKRSRMPTSMPAFFSSEKLCSHQVSANGAKSANSHNTSFEGLQTSCEFEKDENQNDRPVIGVGTRHISEAKQKRDDAQSSVELQNQNAERLSDSRIPSLSIPLNPVLPPSLAGQMQQTLQQQQQELQQQLQQQQQQLQQQQQQLLLPPPLAMFNQLPSVGPNNVSDMPPEMAAVHMQMLHMQQLLHMQQMLGGMPTGMPSDGNLGSLGPNLSHYSKLDAQKTPIPMETSNNMFPIHPGLQNICPSMPVGFPGLPNSTIGIGDSENISKIHGTTPANLGQLTNAFPAGLPGLSGLPGFPGTPFSFPGLLNAPSGLPNGFPNSIPGLATGLPNSMLNLLPGQQTNLPPNVQNSLSLSYPGVLNCNSFGGMIPSLQQPGQVPLMSGKGRGRLNRAAPC